MSLKQELGYNEKLLRRHRASKMFARICRASTWAAMLILAVLLVSVVARVNHNGEVSVFIDGDTPPEEKLAEVQQLLEAHPHVDKVNRDVDPSGTISFYLDVNGTVTDEDNTVIGDSLRSRLKSLMESRDLIPFELSGSGTSITVTTPAAADETLKEIAKSLKADANVAEVTDSAHWWSGHVFECQLAEGTPRSAAEKSLTARMEAVRGMLWQRTEFEIKDEGSGSYRVLTPEASDAALTKIAESLDQQGNVKTVSSLSDQKGFAVKTRVRYEDIKYELEAELLEVEDAYLTLDSSEPVVAWDWGFLTRYPSTLYPEKAGILAGIWGSIWLVMLTAMIAVPLGVGAAVYLEEYSNDTWVTRLIKLNLANLAGVPSIVYGILGFAVFVRFFGADPIMIGDIQILPLGPTVLAGACTLALLILPVIIVATQEALKAIPSSIRSASVALGATKWQTIRHQVLPAGLPGIATGVILALSRALGETAPIVVIGVLAFTRTTPGNIESPADLVNNPSGIAEVPFDKFATLPIQVYNWVSDSRPEFAAQAARGILVLLVVLLLINSVAIYIRNRYQKNLKW